MFIAGILKIMEVQEEAVLI